MTTLSRPSTSHAPAINEPAWDVAYLFPAQGTWTETEYLNRITERGFELASRSLEKLPMPTELHQIIAAYLYDELRAFVKQRQLGLVLFAGLRVRTAPGQIREPDVVFLSQQNFAKRAAQVWNGADLAIEVVSEDDPDRDYVTKRAEYAQAGISEYWLVDPRTKTIQILRLNNGQYVVHGEFKAGTKANSALLVGFELLVDEVMTGGTPR